MATFVKDKSCAFKQIGDQTDLPTKQRSEARMKSYQSATDARAWVNNISENKQYIIDLIGADFSKNNQQGKYVPVDVLVKTLMANKDADIKRLNAIIKDLQAFINELNLNPEEMRKYKQMKASWGAGDGVPSVKKSSIPVATEPQKHTRTASESRYKKTHGLVESPRTSSESRLQSPRSDAAQATSSSSDVDFPKTTSTRQHPRGAIRTRLPESVSASTSSDHSTRKQRKHHSPINTTTGSIVVPVATPGTVPGTVSSATVTPARHRTESESSIPKSVVAGSVHSVAVAPARHMSDSESSIPQNMVAVRPQAVAVPLIADGPVRHETDSESSIPRNVIAIPEPVHVDIESSHKDVQVHSHMVSVDSETQSAKILHELADKEQQVISEVERLVSKTSYTSMKCRIPVPVPVQTSEVKLTKEEVVTQTPTSPSKDNATTYEEKYRGPKKCAPGCECEHHKEIARQAVEKLEILQEILDERDQLQEKLNASNLELRQVKGQLNDKESCDEEITAMAHEVERLKAAGITDELKIVNAELQLLKKYCKKLIYIKDENKKLKNEVKNLKTQNTSKHSANLEEYHTSLMVSPSGGSASDQSLNEQELRKQLQAKIAALKDVTRQRDKLQSNVSKLEQKLKKYDNLSNEIKTFKERSKVLDAVIEEKLDLERRLDKVAHLEHDLLSLKQRADKADELQRALENAQNKLLEMHDSPSFQMNALTFAHERIVPNTASLDLLKHKAKEADVLRVERDKMRVRIDELTHTENEFKKLQGKYRSLEAIRNERDIYKSKTDELSGLKEDYKSLREQAAQVNSLSDERDVLLRKICDLECVIADQENEIGRLVLHIDRLSKGQDKQQDRAKHIITDLRIEIEKKNSLIANSEDHLASVQSQLKQTIAKLTSETSALKQQVCQTDTSCHDLQNRLDSLTNKLSDANIALEKEKSICRCYKAKMVALNEDNNRLQEIADRISDLADSGKMESILRKSHEAVCKAAKRISKYSNGTNRPSTSTATNTQQSSLRESATTDTELLDLPVPVAHSTNETGVDPIPSPLINCSCSTSTSTRNLSTGGSAAVDYEEREMKTVSLGVNEGHTASDHPSQRTSRSSDPHTKRTSMESSILVDYAELDARTNDDYVMMVEAAVDTNVPTRDYSGNTATVHMYYSTGAKSTFPKTRSVGTLTDTSSNSQQPQVPHQGAISAEHGKVPSCRQYFGATDGPKKICVDSAATQVEMLAREKRGDIKLDNLTCICRGVQHPICECVSTGMSSAPKLEVDKSKGSEYRQLQEELRKKEKENKELRKQRDTLIMENQALRKHANELKEIAKSQISSLSGELKKSREVLAMSEKTDDTKTVKELQKLNKTLQQEVIKLECDCNALKKQKEQPCADSQDHGKQFEEKHTSTITYPQTGKSPSEQYVPAQHLPTAESGKQIQMPGRLPTIKSDERTQSQAFAPLKDLSKPPPSQPQAKYPVQTLQDTSPVKSKEAYVQGTIPGAGPIISPPVYSDQARPETTQIKPQEAYPPKDISGPAPIKPQEAYSKETLPGVGRIIPQPAYSDQARPETTSIKPQEAYPRKDISGPAPIKPQKPYSRETVPGVGQIISPSAYSDKPRPETTPIKPKETYQQKDISGPAPIKPQEVYSKQGLPGVDEIISQSGYSDQPRPETTGMKPQEAYPRKDISGPAPIKSQKTYSRETVPGVGQIISPSAYSDKPRPETTPIKPKETYQQKDISGSAPIKPQEVYSKQTLPGVGQIISQPAYSDQRRPETTAMKPQEPYPRKDISGPAPIKSQKEYSRETLPGVGQTISPPAYSDQRRPETTAMKPQEPYPRKDISGHAPIKSQKEYSREILPGVGEIISTPAYSDKPRPGTTAMKPEETYQQKDMSGPAPIKPQEVYSGQTLPGVSQIISQPAYSDKPRPETTAMKPQGAYPHKDISGPAHIKPQETYSRETLPGVGKIISTSAYSDKPRPESTQNKPRESYQQKNTSGPAVKKPRVTLQESTPVPIQIGFNVETFPETFAEAEALPGTVAMQSHAAFLDQVLTGTAQTEAETIPRKSIIATFPTFGETIAQKPLAEDTIKVTDFDQPELLPMEKSDSSLMREIGELKRQNEQLRADGNNDDELKELQKRLQQCNEKNDELEKDKSGDLEDLQKLMRQLKECKDKLEEAGIPPPAAVTAIPSSERPKRNSIADLLNEIDHLRKQLADCKGQLEQVPSSGDKKDDDQLAKEIEDLRKQLQHCKSKLDEDEKRLADKPSKTISQLRSLADKDNKENEELKKELGKLKKELADSAKMIEGKVPVQELEKENDDLRNQLEQLKQELDEARSKEPPVKDDMFRESIKAQNETLGKQLEQCTDELEDLRKQLENCRKDLEAQKKIAATKVPSAQISNLQNENDDLRKELDNLKNQLAISKDLLNNERISPKPSDSSKELDDLRKQLAACKSQLEDANKRLEDCQKHLENEKKKLEDKQKRLSAAQLMASSPVGNQKDLDDLRKQLEDCKKELEEAKKKSPFTATAPTTGLTTPVKATPSKAGGDPKELNDLRKQLDDCRKQLEQCGKELEEQKKLTEQAAAAGASSKIPADAAELEKLRQQLADSKKELEEERKKNPASAGTASSATPTTAGDNQKDLDDLRKQLADCKKELEVERQNKAGPDADAIQKELDDMRKQLADAKKDLEEEKKDKAALAAAASSAAPTAAANQKELDDLRKQLADSKKELEEEKKKKPDPTTADANQKELDDLRKQLADCQKELEVERKKKAAPDTTADANQKELDDLRKQLADSNKELEDEKKKKSDPTIAGGNQKDLDDLRKQLADCKKELEEERKKNPASPAAASSATPTNAGANQKELDDLRKQLADCQKELDIERKKKPALAGSTTAGDNQKELDDLKKQLADSKKDLEDERKKNPASAAAASSATPTTAGDNQKELDDLKKQLADSKKDLEDERKKNPDPATAAAFATPGGNQKDLDDLRKKLADCQKELEIERNKKPDSAAATTAGANQKDLDDLRKQLADCQKELELERKKKSTPDIGAAGGGKAPIDNSGMGGAVAPKSELDDCLKKLAELQKQFDKLLNENMQLKGIKDTGDPEKNKNLAMNTHSDSDYDDLLKQLKAEKDRNKKIEDALANGDNTAIFEDYKNRLAELQAKLKDCETKSRILEERNSKISNLEKELEKTKKQSSHAIKATRSSYERDIANLQDKYIQGIEKLQASHEEIISQGHKELEAEIESLRKDSAEKQTAIDDLRCICFAKKKKPALCQTLTFEDLQHMHTKICEATAKVMGNVKKHEAETALGPCTYKQRQHVAQTQVAKLQMEVALERQRLENLKKALDIERNTQAAMTQHFERQAKLIRMPQVQVLRTYPYIPESSMLDACRCSSAIELTPRMKRCRHCKEHLSSTSMKHMA